MALTPSRTGRLLPLVLLAFLLATCATATASTVRPAPQRWILLGERDGVEAIAPLVAAQSRRAAEQPRVTDLSAPGAGIEAVIQQFAALPERTPDRFILRPGGADAAAGSPLSPARYGELVGALLVTLQARAPVTITTIPERTPVAGGSDALTIARRLWRMAEYNEVIRVAARLYGATVVEAQGSPNDLGVVWPSGASLEGLRVRTDRGAAAGLRQDTLAKVGDSITSSPAFLGDLTEEGLHAEGHAALVETFRLATGARTSPGGAATPSLFARESLAARDRWSVADALDGGDLSPLAREIDALHSGVAVVMFGTNDLTHLPLATFEEHIDRLLSELDRRGVVALLSTIPERRDSAEFAARVPSFNRAIRALALAHGVPLVDYHAAMAGLPNAGLSPDGIHPSVCPDGPAVLTPACLRYGYNLRNLLTLQALNRLHAELAAPAVWLDEDPIGGR
jgi:hypothetical protein